jgi:osmotically-inducible protein OsmY
MTSTKKAAKKKAKKAEKRAIKAGEAAADRAAELAEQAGDLAHDKADELAKFLRESEAVAKAQSKGLELADLAQVKGGELAGLAKAKWQEAELDDRTAKLAKQVRDSDASKEATKKAKEASKRAREATDVGLASVGGWLASGPAAEKMGIAPKRRVPGLVWALIGAAVGFMAAKAMAGSSSDDVRDDLAAAAERLAAKAPHPAGTVLADTIRTTLQGDPRTAELRQVNINVSEGTVFVRGSIPSGIDADAVRQVIAGVPGVDDVDLQLTPA